MIQLTDYKTQKIEQFKSWEDVYSHVRFKHVVDKKEVKLKSIIGQYSFDTKNPCGIKSCRTEHQHGFVVLCESGIATNIGRDCGKREFGVEFMELRKKFREDFNAMKTRERLHSLKLKSDEYLQQISYIRRRDGLAGSYAYGKMHAIITEHETFTQHEIDRLKSRAAKGQNTINVSRLGTDEERELHEVTTNSTIDDDSFYVDEQVGTIFGLKSVIDYPKIKEHLTIELPKLFDELNNTDPDILTNSALRRWSRRISGIDEKISEARDIIDDCNRFYLESNIKFILQYSKYL